MVDDKAAPSARPEVQRIFPLDLVISGGYKVFLAASFVWLIVIVALAGALFIVSDGSLDLIDVLRIGLLSAVVLLFGGLGAVLGGAALKILKSCTRGVVIDADKVSILIVRNVSIRDSGIKEIPRSEIEMVEIVPDGKKRRGRRSVETVRFRQWNGSETLVHGVVDGEKLASLPQTNGRADLTVSSGRRDAP